MSKILKTHPFAPIPDAIGQDILVLTPHPAAARALGVPHIKLETLAARLLAENGLGIASAVKSRQLLRTAVRRRTEESDVSGYAGLISETLATILRTGIDTDRLMQHGSGRVRVLAAVAAEYVRLLREQHLVDAAEVVHQASLLPVKPEKILVYGYFRARSEEIEFLNKLAADESIYYLPCGKRDIFYSNIQWSDSMLANGWDEDSGNSEAEQTIGKYAAECFAERSTRCPDAVKAFRCRDAEAETRFILGSVKRLILDGVDAGSIAIVCRRPEEYARIFDEVGAEYGLPLCINVQVPIGTTAVGALITQTIEAVRTGLDSEPTARLLMHPFGPDNAEGAWPKARSTRPCGVEEWSRLWPDAAGLSWPESQSPAMWANTLNDFLNGLKVKQKAAENARELLALYTFQDTLREAVNAEPRTEISFEAFASLIADILAESSTPFSPSLVGVEVFSPDTLIGGNYDHIFAAGMAEGVFPAAVVDNPVVDFYERRQLAGHGLAFESAAEIARWASASFFLTLIAAQRSVTLTYPVQEGRDETLPSPFLERLGVNITDAPFDHASSIEERRHDILPLFDIEPGDDAALAFSRTSYTAELARGREPGITEYDGVIARSLDATARMWSVSQFTQIGQCAFRWFASKVLRLELPDEAVNEIDRRTLGSFYHKVLELSVEPLLGRADIRSAVIAGLDDAFTAAEADPELKVTSLPNWDKLRNDHLRILRRTVNSEDFIQEGAVILELEKKFEGEWEGLPMQGFIDRIDETPDGLFAIDYKTGSSAPKGIKDTDGRLKIDVQLPLYTHVALRSLYPDKELGKGGYYSIRKGKILKKAGLEKMEELAELPAFVKATLAAGRFAVEPDVKGEACKYCDFADVCRIGSRRRVDDAV
ncbi:MAG: PD-(D/E)XK nuclease family protein [Acidobacteria bacterium]|nr:PD-(D/E)XK nuclease family protein [Acidobacteriota bacterium]